MHSAIRKFQRENSPTRTFYNDKGTPFGYVYDDSFLKFERKKDRLRIFGNRAHAVDLELFEGLIRMGVRIVIIDEKDGDLFRIWRTSIQKLQAAPRRKLAGVLRVIIELPKCELLDGQPEEWYVARRSA